MIKHVEVPFLHAEIQGEECGITGTGNTWHYLLYEGNAEMFIDVTGDSGMALIKDVINALEAI